MAENVIVSPEEGITENDYDPDYLKEVIKRNEKVKAQFLKIVGGEPTTISEKQVHEKSNLRANGDLGILYRYFFTKYVSIRLKEDAKSDVLDEHASIFPFQTKPTLDVIEMPKLDDKFCDEIKEFAEKHFGDCDIDGLKNLFWANVKDFQETHFPNPPAADKLARLIEVGSPSNSGDTKETFPECDYLKNFIRLNRGGTLWYQQFQTKYNAACKANEKDLTLPKKLGFYFRFLPDINCCELLLLLKTNFYETDREKYVHLFEKYLFFFKNAVDRPNHPVCFIDDTLFACLKFKKEYETFQEGKSVFDCVWELCLMTLVHCRRYMPDAKQPISLKPDLSDLEKVVTYADALLKGVESVNVYYGEPHLRFKVLLLLDDTAFLINYSGRTSLNANDWIGQTLKSALLNREIKRLKFYNAYWGEESLYEMPQQKEEIRRFTQQLTETERNAKRLEPSHPLKFLVQPYLKKYFSLLPAIPHSSDE